jgi:micrococcal nuclease
MIQRIVSGGQTGADQAALDVAIELGIPHGGWIPKGRKTLDGDTVVIDYQGKTEKVRLLRVNTPESVYRDKKQNIPMGKVASDYTKGRLEKETVDLGFEGPKRGNYSRLLAYVVVNGVNFSLELVRKGLSPCYTKY